MVQRVDVLVNAADVDEPMGEVEMKLSPQGNCENPEHIPSDQLRVAVNLLVCRERYKPSRPEPHHHNFKGGERHHAQGPVPQVVTHVRECWEAVGILPCGKRLDVEREEEETVIQETITEVDREPIQNRPQREAVGKRSDVVREINEQSDGHQKPDQIRVPEEILQGDNTL